MSQDVKCQCPIHAIGLTTYHIHPPLPHAPTPCQPFSEKYSNGPGAIKNGQMSKMAIIGPDICLKVSRVQI